MSKHIKLDTAIEHTNQLYHGNEVEAWLESLPTIEVIEEELKGCDKVDKRFSEDAISREYIKTLLENNLTGTCKDVVVHTIENAPSVIPKAKEGEWILECDAEGEGDNLYRCPECGQRCGCQEYDLPNYCGHCGRKLKGAEDEVVDFQIIETPNCSECEHYEDHHTSLACATCPVITKVWGGTKK